MTGDTGGDDSDGTSDGSPTDPAGGDDDPGDEETPDAASDGAADGEADAPGDVADGEDTDADETPGADDTDGTGDSPSPGPSRSGDRRSSAGRSGPDATADEADVDPERVAELTETVAELRGELDRLESRVDEKTVHRSDVEAELKRYVRARQRRGHATGWGPYIVLLYGTVMTLGAFYYLGGLVAIAAMLVVWLSTLGLYVVSVVLGGFVGGLRKVGAVRDLVGKFR